MKFAPSRPLHTPFCPMTSGAPWLVQGASAATAPADPAAPFGPEADGPAVPGVTPDPAAVPGAVAVCDPAGAPGWAAAGAPAVSPTTPTDPAAAGRPDVDTGPDPSVATIRSSDTREPHAVTKSDTAQKPASEAACRRRSRPRARPLDTYLAPFTRDTSPQQRLNFADPAICSLVSAIEPELLPSSLSTRYSTSAGQCSRDRFRVDRHPGGRA